MHKSSPKKFLFFWEQTSLKCVLIHDIIFMIHPSEII